MNPSNKRDFKSWEKFNKVSPYNKGVGKFSQYSINFTLNKIKCRTFQNFHFITQNESLNTFTLHSQHILHSSGGRLPSLHLGHSPAKQNIHRSSSNPSLLFASCTHTSSMVQHLWIILTFNSRTSQLGEFMHKELDLSDLKCTTYKTTQTHIRNNNFIHFLTGQIWSSIKTLNGSHTCIITLAHQPHIELTSHGLKQ